MNPADCPSDYVDPRDLICFPSPGGWTIGIVDWENTDDYTVIACVEDMRFPFQNTETVCVRTRDLNPAAGQLIGREFPTLEAAWSALEKYAQ